MNIHLDNSNVIIEAHPRSTCTKGTVPASTPVHDNDSTISDQTVTRITALLGPVQQNHHQQTSGLEEDPKPVHISKQASMALSPPTSVLNSAPINDPYGALQQSQIHLGKHALESSSLSATQISLSTADSQILSPEHVCAVQASTAKPFVSTALAFPPRVVTQPIRISQGEVPQQPDTVLQSAGVSCFQHSHTPSSGSTKKHLHRISESRRATPNTQAHPDLPTQANHTNEAQGLLAPTVHQICSYASFVSAGGVEATDSYTAAGEMRYPIVSLGDWIAVKHSKRQSGGDTSCDSDIPSHSQPVQCTNKFNMLLSEFSSEDIESGGTKASGDGAVIDSLTATANSNLHGTSESTHGSQAADHTTSEPLAIFENSTGAQSNYKESDGASAPRYSYRISRLSNCCLSI